MMQSVAALGGAVLIALVGFVLLKLGLFPRRRGDTLFCARCGYGLTANVSGVCPECGTSTTDRAPLRGERRRRVGLGAAGVLFALVGIVGTIVASKPLIDQVDWYRFRPLAWVLEDARSKAMLVNGRAWGEIDRRRKAGRLSDADERRVTELALSIQNDPKPGDPLGGALHHLGRRWEAGKLADEQVDRMFVQSVRTTWTPRPIVLVGQPLPVKYDGERRLPVVETAGEWFIRIRLDGSTNDMRMYSNGGSIHEYGGSIFGLDRKATTPGPQEIELRERVEISRKTADQEREQQPVWQGGVTHKLKVEALAQRSPRFIKPVEGSAALRSGVERSIQIKDFVARGADASPAFTVLITSPPANLAFELIARVDGKEYRQGSLTAEKGVGANHGFGIWQLRGAQPAKADIILRPSEQAATRSVALFDYWDGGEIVFKDLPIKSEKQ